MSREAARSGLYAAVDTIIDVARREFDPVRALRRGGGGSPTVARLVKRNRLLDEHIVQPELERHQELARRQIDLTIEAVVADEPITTKRAALLEADIYYAAIAPAAPADRREAIATAVLERFAGVADAIGPVIAAPSDDWWPAIESALTAAEVTSLIETNFSFADRMAAYDDVLRFETRLDPGELLGGLGRALPTVRVEYTDESLRVMKRAEAAVRREYERELQRRYPTATDGGHTSAADGVSHRDRTNDGH